MRPKCYVWLHKDGTFEIDTSIWKDGGKRLSKVTKYPGRVLLTYIQYKGGCPKYLMPSRGTIWRHKKLWEKGGLI